MRGPKGRSGLRTDSERGKWGGGGGQETEIKAEAK